MRDTKPIIYKVNYRQSLLQLNKGESLKINTVYEKPISTASTIANYWTSRLDGNRLFIQENDKDGVYIKRIR